MADLDMPVEDEAREGAGEGEDLSYRAAEAAEQAGKDAVTKAGRQIRNALLTIIIIHVVIPLLMLPFAPAMVAILILFFVMIVSSLAFGVYRRSRTAAVIILAITGGLSWQLLRMRIYPSGVPGWAVLMDLVAIYYIFLGMKGTFMYHKITKK